MAERQEIRGALQAHLLLLGWTNETALENVSFEPPADATTPFQRVNTIFAEPRTYGVGGSSQQTGTFQILLSYPVNIGAGVPDARAKVIADHFAFLTKVPVGGPMKAKVMRKPEIQRLGNVNGRDVTVIRVRFSDR